MILKFVRLILVVSLFISPLMMITDSHANSVSSVTELTEDTKPLEGESNQANTSMLNNQTSVNESTGNKASSAPSKTTPEVGKHVMANMNPASMILSLFLVLGLIIICALILKRFNLTQHNLSQLKIITTLRLGTKERLIVVQVGEQQLLLGVTGQQVSLLETLAEPLTNQEVKTGDLPKNILSFLSAKKSNV